jgi:cytochrome c oxidase subunit 2
VKRRLFLSSALGAFVAGACRGAFSQPKVQVHKIVARKFAYLPNVVTVKKGQPVVLEFTAPEVVMGMNCPDLNIRADIIPGQVASVRFTPGKAGTYEYFCDIFCGDGHEAMTGKIKVVA